MRIPIILSAAVALVMLAGAPLAGGALGTTALAAQDQQAAKQREPVDIEADSMEVLQERDMVIFNGNVRATKGDTRLFAERLEVFLEAADKKGAETRNEAARQNDEVREIVASGGVRIVRPDMTITGQRARMDVRRDVVWVSGDVVVKREDATVRGQKLFADLKASITRMEAGQRQRVRATFSRK